MTARRASLSTRLARLEQATPGTGRCRRCGGACCGSGPIPLRLVARVLAATPEQPAGVCFCSCCPTWGMVLARAFPGADGDDARDACPNRRP